MIPKILHLTSKTKQLNGEENILLRKNRKVLKGWQINLFDDTDNEAIVRKYFPEYWNKYNSIKKGVAKADIARCMYMYVYGGMYADTDYLFLKDIPSELLQKKCIIPAECWKTPQTPYLGNCIFMSEKEVGFWKDYIDHVFKSIELDTLHENRIIDVTGPGGITEFYLSNKDKYPYIHVTPKNQFHPLQCWHGLRIQTDKSTIGIHFCFGSWRTKNILKRYYYILVQRMQALGLILFQ